jgi:hypothetical protein
MCTGGGYALSWLEQYLHTEVAPLLRGRYTDAGQGPGGHIARIDAVSPVLEVQEEITARMPTAPEASRLDVPRARLFSR